MAELSPQQINDLIRELHERVDDSSGPFCLECTPVHAIKYPQLIRPWPCRTIRILDGEEVRRA